MLSEWGASMGKTICFASSKGGSGKTTITASFGKLISEFGNLVLMVDFDEATNGLSLLYIHEINEYVEEYSAQGVNFEGMFPTPEAGSPDVVFVGDDLAVAPATFQFKQSEQLQIRDYKQRLLDVIKEFRDEYDYILIDAQAGSDAASLAALDPEVSDLVILVSEYDPMSAAGIERLKSLAPKELAFDRTFVLLNKMLPEFVESFKDFFAVSHYLPPIPWTSDAVRAYSKRSLAIDTTNGNEFTLAIIQALRALPLANLRDSYESWISNKAPLLRQPVDEQYTDIEILLSASTERLLQLERRSRRLSLLQITGMGLASLMMMALLVALILQNPPDKTLMQLAFPFLGLATAVALLSVGPILINRLRPVRTAEIVEKERLQRQRTVYIERLRELEFLKQASDRELIERQFGRSA